MRLKEMQGSPLIVDILVPTDVRTFYGVAQVARAFAEVDTAVREHSELLESRSEKRRSYELRYFRVNSPPHTSILADPAWLAVFLGLITVGISFVAAYPKLKANTREIYRDSAWAIRFGKAEAQKVVGAVSGISDHYRQQLAIGVELYLDHVAASSPDAVEKFLRRALRLSKALGANHELPQVRVHENNVNAG